MLYPLDQYILPHFVVGPLLGVSSENKVSALCFLQTLNFLNTYPKMAPSELHLKSIQFGLAIWLTYQGQKWHCKSPESKLEEAPQLPP